ncbi:MAG: carboxypeptidase regulatory-like domain-containing protein [Chloroflexi bacterium]|nr:carboxypeptidase regulatory-like domain-containing protein [Chloroflexota bacterium]
MSFVNSPAVQYTTDGKPRERLGCGSQVARVLTVVLMVLALALVAYPLLGTNLASRVARSDGAVRGVVVGAQEQPLAEAQVFLVAAPDVTVTTQADGRFALDALPSGAQVLIVVVNEIGQEYPVNILSGAITEVGVLAYLAPPDE